MNKKIVQTALSLKEQYGTSDPTELCRCLGITYLRADLPKKLGGFYMENKGRQAVAVAEALEAPFDRAVSAHELGHALLHKGLNFIFLCDNTNFLPGRYEREADLFAAALLIDGDRLKAGKSISVLSGESGVPAYAVQKLIEITGESL